MSRRRGTAKPDGPEYPRRATTTTTILQLPLQQYFGCCTLLTRKIVGLNLRTANLARGFSSTILSKFTWRRYALSGASGTVVNSSTRRHVMSGSDGHKLFILSLTLTKFPSKKILIKLLVKLFF